MCDSHSVVFGSPALLVKMQILGSHFISPELQIFRGRSQESALTLQSSQDLT